MCKEMQQYLKVLFPVNGKKYSRSYNLSNAKTRIVGMQSNKNLSNHKLIDKIINSWLNSYLETFQFIMELLIIIITLILLNKNKR